MSPFVLSKEQKNTNLIYDCYAVSNHYGSVGFGHYTAYGQNPHTKEWYYFDDSSVTKSTTRDVVSTAAYSLFYRLREHVPDIKNIAYAHLE